VRADQPEAAAGGRARSRFAGEGLALLATVLWAGSFILARGLRNDVPPVALNFWRWAIASLVVVPFTLQQTVSNQAAVRRHWRYLAVAAALGVTVYNTLVYVAGRTTAAVNLSLIGICSPIFIVLLARFYGAERIGRWRVLGIALAVTGVVVLVSGGSARSLASLEVRSGDLWMLAATMVFAVYSLLARRRPAELPLPAFVLCTFWLGTVFELPAYLVERAVKGSFALTAPTVEGLLYVGLAASVVAFVAWNAAIDRVGAARPALIYYLIPVFTAVGGVLFLHEHVGLVEVGSMVLIVCGTAVGARGGGEPSRQG
jgi:drug/metabolite transporter (DMT)-like permease